MTRPTRWGWTRRGLAAPRARWIAVFTATALSLHEAGSTAELQSPRAAALPGLLAESWLDVKTDHFDILTNAREGVAVGVGRRLEQFRAVLAVANPELRAVPVLPVEIYVFRDQATMDVFRPDEIENVSGFASQVAGRNVFVMNGEVEGNEKSQVVCHEFTHLYLADNLPELPLWMNEGLAEYYGTFRPRGSTAEVGHRQDWMVEWIAEHPPVGLDLMFAINTRASAYTRDNPLRTSTYAQGWATVHYLMTDAARARKLSAVLQGMREGASARAAFEREFPQADWPALVEATQHHVRDEFVEPRTIALEQRLQKAAVTTRPAAPSEAAVRLGELLCDLGPEYAADGATCFRAALASDSTNARAWSGAGLAADIGGDSTGAERCYARASARSRDDRRAALMIALGTRERWLRVGQHEGFEHESLVPIIRTARSRFARCLELEPQDPEALLGFGQTFVALGEMPDTAYRALTRAKELMPGRADAHATFERAQALRHSDSKK